MDYIKNQNDGLEKKFTISRKLVGFFDIILFFVLWIFLAYLFKGQEFSLIEAVVFYFIPIGLAWEMIEMLREKAINKFVTFTLAGALFYVLVIVLTKLTRDATADEMIFVYIFLTVEFAWLLLKTRFMRINKT